MPDPICPNCGSTRTYRKKREGLLQTKIYPKLGKYPWECTDCRKPFISKGRGVAKRRKKRSTDDSGITNGSTGSENPSSAGD